MTKAQDLRMVLAEVAPDLVSLVLEPSGHGWHTVAWKRYLTRSEHDVVNRAFNIIRVRNGLPLRCDDCVWSAYQAQTSASFDVLNNGCPHVEAMA